MIGALLAALLLSVSLPAGDTGPDFILPPTDSTGSAHLDFVVQLELVNDYVNTNCVYTDQGDANPWGRCGLKGWHGNCKDYALEKRAELILAGVDRRRMAVWYVFVPTTDLLTGSHFMSGHAVLVVDGTWVLDNRFDFVAHRGFQESQGYQFVCAIPDRNLYDGKSHISDQARCEEK